VTRYGAAALSSHGALRPRQKEQILAQTLGLPTTTVSFSAMGVFITSAAQGILRENTADQLWDPVFQLGQLTSVSPPAGQTGPLLASPGVRALVAFASRDRASRVRVRGGVLSCLARGRR
jgi:hypothetical protein